jgi:hypothetical protein
MQAYTHTQVYTARVCVSGGYYASLHTPVYTGINYTHLGGFFAESPMSPEFWI